jgi:hypothetical protein
MVPPDCGSASGARQNADMSLRPVAGVAAVVGLVLLLGACGERGESLARPSKAYCEAAFRYEEQIQKKPQPSIDEQITMVAKLAELAPPDIAADAAVFLDAMQRVETDPSVKDNPRVQAAVENVNRRTSSGCGFFEQEPNTGF